MSYTLFLDDERTPHDRYISLEYRDLKVRVAKSTPDAQAIIELYGWPEYLALDHDLGYEDTTMVFLNWLKDRWIAEGSQRQVPEFTVHSQNPVGALNIRRFMHKWAVESMR